MKFYINRDYLYLFFISRTIYFNIGLYLYKLLNYEMLKLVANKNKIEFLKKFRQAAYCVLF